MRNSAEWSVPSSSFRLRSHALAILSSCVMLLSAGGSPGISDSDCEQKRHGLKIVCCGLMQRRVTAELDSLCQKAAPVTTLASDLADHSASPNGPADDLNANSIQGRPQFRLSDSAEIVRLPISLRRIPAYPARAKRMGTSVRGSPSRGRRPGVSMI